MANVTPADANFDRRLIGVGRAGLTGSVGGGLLSILPDLKNKDVTPLHAGMDH